MKQKLYLDYFNQLNLPRSNSHKGQNGKLLLIGGSKLFHAASKWSLDVASKIVDMVFYSSVQSNNELIRQAKAEFWNGIVVSRTELTSYIDEADCILIGPGMERDQATEILVNQLLTDYPTKKFVIDAGALQMVEPSLLNSHHIITPHFGEMQRLLSKVRVSRVDLDDLQVTILLKGKLDKVTWFEAGKKKEVEVDGGNEGMTKGGTGDALAGLTAALYCSNKAHVAAIVASKVNKQAGDELYKTVGPYFNTSDLVEMIPKVLWSLVKH